MRNFLVAYNKNSSLSYHHLKIVNGEPMCVPVYEEMIFCAVFLEGVRVLTPKNESQQVFFDAFTDQERYLISSEFFDSSLIQNDDFRKNNTPFCPVLKPIWGEVLSYDPISHDLTYYVLPFVQSGDYTPVTLYLHSYDKGYDPNLFNYSWLQTQPLMTGGTKQNPLIVSMLTILNTVEAYFDTTDLDLFVLHRSDIDPFKGRLSGLHNPLLRKDQVHLDLIDNLYIAHD